MHFLVCFYFNWTKTKKQFIRLANAILVNLVGQFLGEWHLYSGTACPHLYFCITSVLPVTVGCFSFDSAVLIYLFPCVISQHVKEQTKHKRYAAM